MQDLGTLGRDAAYASSINVDGLVVGGSWLPGNKGSHAFLYDGSQLRDLGTLPGYDFSWA